MVHDRDDALRSLQGAWREHIDNETPFKVESARALRKVLHDVVNGRAEWNDFFKTDQEFLNNQVGWRAVVAYRDLVEAHPDAVRTAVGRVLGGGDAGSFFSALDGEGVTFDDYPAIRGEGSRATLASLFLLIADPEHHPIYRVQNTGKPLEQLLGRKINVGKPAERLERYYEGLDELAPLLGEGDEAPRHRLDVQGALWIAKGYGLEILDEAGNEGAGSKKLVDDREQKPVPAERAVVASIADRLDDPDVHIVKVAPGHGASEWDDCLDGGYVCVGWDAVGDLAAFDTFEAFMEAFKVAYPFNGHLSTSFRKGRELWTLKTLAEGDLVIANRGISEILAIGVVTGDGYRYREDRDRYRHTVSVQWDTSYATQIPRKPYWATVTVRPVDRATLEVILGTRESYRRTWSLRADRLTAHASVPERDMAAGDRVQVDVGSACREARAGDRVLVWLVDDGPALYAIARLRMDPMPAPNADGNPSWSLDLEIATDLTEPLHADVFRAEPVLSNLDALDAVPADVTTVAAHQWKRISELLEGSESATTPPARVAPEPLSLSEIEHTTGIPTSELERWIRALDRKGQAVLYGPPGTGKTFVARMLAAHLAGGHDGIVDLVQFHPAYAYEDFVQGLRPVSRDGELSYEMVPGRLLDFLDVARGATGPCVLILDEINRADLARVFGELMYLLEYRHEEVPLAGGGRLSIPSNVRLIGTMNTADRSIALVDHALRRRFAFLRLDPKLDVLVRYHREGPNGPLAHALAHVLEDLHGEIDDANLSIGISYFLVDDLKGTIEDVWRMEIEPYLEELFFDRADPIGRFAWTEVARRLGLA